MAPGPTSRRRRVDRQPGSGRRTSRRAPGRSTWPSRTRLHRPTELASLLPIHALVRKRCGSPQAINPPTRQATSRAVMRWLRTPPSACRRSPLASDIRGGRATASDLTRKSPAPSGSVAVANVLMIRSRHQSGSHALLPTATTVHNVVIHPARRRRPPAISFIGISTAGAYT